MILQNFLTFMAKDCVANRYLKNESFDDLHLYRKLELRQEKLFGKTEWKRRLKWIGQKITNKMLKVSNWLLERVESAFTRTDWTMIFEIQKYELIKNTL